MARKTAFTIPSLEEMEHADQQVISVYSALKGVTGKSSSASSSDVPKASTSHASAVVSTSLEDNVNSRTAKPPPAKPPLVSSVKSGVTTKPMGVKIVPVLSGNKHQGNRPTSGAVALNTASGTSEPAAGVGPSKPGKTNAIIVSARQKGNPVLKFIRNVPWEFGDIVPDYQLGQTSCALFLRMCTNPVVWCDCSTRYHLLYPEYVHERLKQLGHSFDLRVLLMLIDVKDPHHALKEVAKMCILADCSLILAFSVEEAGRYLETYKSFEKKPPDLIMERTEANFLAQVTDVFTSARRINKTDAMTVLSAFGTVKGVLQSSEDELSLCPGFGPQKAQRLHRLIHEPFIKAKKTKTCQPTDEAGGHPSSSSASVDSKKHENKQREKV